MARVAGPLHAQVLEPECPVDDDESSVDTQDAFLDMLGLANVDKGEGEPLLVMDEEVVVKDPIRKNKGLSEVPISLPPKCSRYGIAPRQCAAVVVPGFYSEAECQALLQLAKQQQNSFQYITEASHTAPDGTSYTVQLQNPNPHKLAVMEHAPTSRILWNRLEPYLKQAQWMKDYVERTNYGPPVGLNPRLRVLQYDASDEDRFEPHFDCTTHVGQHYTSRITVLLYLNSGGSQDFDGGETLYLDSHISNYNNNNSQKATYKQDTGSSDETGSTVKITPQMGTLVMFEHDLYHAGAPLLWGRKHVMRTDILFDDRIAGAASTDNQDEAVSDGKDSTSTDSTFDSQQEQTATDNEGATYAKCLVSQLCQELQWSSEDQAILQDMGLLGMTLEAFLLPGTRMLTEMLLDGGIHSTGQIDSFIHTAKERVL